MNKLIKVTNVNEVCRQLEFKAEDGVKTLSVRYIGEIWYGPYKDKVGGSIEEDGNALTLRLEKRKPITLDYSEAFDTMVLLTEMFKKLEPDSIPPYEVYVRE